MSDRSELRDLVALLFAERISLLVRTLVEGPEALRLLSFLIMMSNECYGVILSPTPSLNLLL